MARAYEYCEDGPISKELLLLSYIREFGVEAVTGRKTLERLEMHNMVLARRIFDAYQSRKHSKDWAQWASDNPNDAELLEIALMASEGNNGE